MNWLWKCIFRPGQKRWQRRRGGSDRYVCAKGRGLPRHNSGSHEWSSPSRGRPARPMWRCNKWGNGSGDMADEQGVRRECGGVTKWQKIFVMNKANTRASLQGTHWKQTHSAVQKFWTTPHFFIVCWKKVKKMQEFIEMCKQMEMQMCGKNCLSYYNRLYLVWPHFMYYIVHDPWKQNKLNLSDDVMSHLCRNLLVILSNLGLFFFFMSYPKIHGGTSMDMNELTQPQKWWISNLFCFLSFSVFPVPSKVILTLLKSGKLLYLHYRYWIKAVGSLKNSLIIAWNFKIRVRLKKCKMIRRRLKWMWVIYTEIIKEAVFLSFRIYLNRYFKISIDLMHHNNNFQYKNALSFYCLLQFNDEKTFFISI